MSFKEYVIKQWNEARSSILSIIFYFATLYFLLDLADVWEISGLKEIFTVLLAGLIVGVGILALIDIIMQAIKYVVDASAKHISNIKDITAMKKEIVQMKKELSTLNKRGNHKNEKKK